MYSHIVKLAKLAHVTPDVVGETVAWFNMRMSGTSRRRMDAHDTILLTLIFGQMRDDYQTLYTATDARLWIFGILTYIYAMTQWDMLEMDTGTVARLLDIADHAQLEFQQLVLAIAVRYPSILLSYHGGVFDADVDAAAEAVADVAAAVAVDF